MTSSSPQASRKRVREENDSLEDMNVPKRLKRNENTEQSEELRLTPLFEKLENLRIEKVKSLKGKRKQSLKKIDTKDVSKKLKFGDDDGLDSSGAEKKSS